jgi:CRP-like cAMP-binding protein
VLAIEHVLEGSAFDHTAQTLTRTVCLALDGGEFLTMLSDNIMLAQRLFRLLLDKPGATRLRVVYRSPVNPAVAATKVPPLQPLDKVLLLRQNQLLGHATTTQLLDLATITREFVLGVGDVLFTETDPPALYYVLNGEVRLDADGAEPIMAGPGCTVGVSEALAGVSVGRRATVTREGSAICLDGDELFEVLADHVGLLQGLFSGILEEDRAARVETAHPAASNDSARIDGVTADV